MVKIRAQKMGDLGFNLECGYTGRRNVDCTIYNKEKKTKEKKKKKTLT